MVKVAFNISDMRMHERSLASSERFDCLQVRAMLDHDLDAHTYTHTRVLKPINTRTGRYLLVILDCSKVGTIEGQEIFFVTKTGIVPIPRHSTYLSEDEARLERNYCNMLNNFLANSGFYFSYSFDITHTAQRRANLPAIEDELQRRAQQAIRV